MSQGAPRTKVSVTIAAGVASKLDALVAAGVYDNRSAAYEEAVTGLLRAHVDAQIEAAVAELDREEEMVEAEEGMAEFSALVRD